MTPKTIEQLQHIWSIPASYEYSSCHSRTCSAIFRPFHTFQNWWRRSNFSGPLEVPALQGHVVENRGNIRSYFTTKRGSHERYTFINTAHAVFTNQLPCRVHKAWKRFKASARPGSQYWSSIRLYCWIFWDGSVPDIGTHVNYGTTRKEDGSVSGTFR